MPTDSEKGVNIKQSASHNYCYYSKPDNVPTQPDALIIWAEYQTIIPIVSSPYFSNVVDVYPIKITASMLEGFHPSQLRPPIT